MATIHKLTKDGSTIFPATITDAIVHPNTGKTLTSMIKDYNVSELFPSEGLDGGNKYNLALAIQVLGTHLSAAQKTGGIKLTFISSVSPYPEEEYYLGKSTWSATASDWDQRFEVGDVVANPSGSWTPGTAEAYIDQQVATLNTNLTSEVIARQTGDNNLRTQLQSEQSTRADQDGNLLALIQAGLRDGDALVFDTVPTQNSANPVTSGGIYSMLRDSNVGFVEDTPTRGSDKILSSGGVFEHAVEYYNLDDLAPLAEGWHYSMSGTTEMYRLTVSSDAVTSGSITIVIGENAYTVSVSSGDSKAAIASAILAAISDDPEYVADATSSSNVITFTARNKGVASVITANSGATGVSVVIAELRAGTENAMYAVSRVLPSTVKEGVHLLFKDVDDVLEEWQYIGGMIYSTNSWRKYWSTDVVEEDNEQSVTSGGVFAHVAETEANVKALLSEADYVKALNVRERAFAFANSYWGATNGVLTIKNSSGSNNSFNRTCLMAVTKDVARLGFVVVNAHCKLDGGSNIQALYFADEQLNIVGTNSGSVTGAENSKLTITVAAADIPGTAKYFAINGGKFAPYIVGSRSRLREISMTKDIYYKSGILPTTVGKAIENSTVIDSTNSWALTDAIPITEDMRACTFVIRNVRKAGNAALTTFYPFGMFFDSDGTTLQTVIPPTPGALTDDVYVTNIPAEAAYMRFNILASDADKVYYEYWSSMHVKNMASEDAYGYRELSLTFNQAVYLKNGEYAVRESTSSTWYLSEKVTVTKAMRRSTIIVHNVRSAGNGTYPFGMFFDSSDTPLENGFVAVSENKTRDIVIFGYNIPENAAYMRFNGSVIEPHIYLEYLSEHHPVILSSKIDPVDGLILPSTNPLEVIRREPGFASIFRNWAFIGDSLSSGTHNCHDAQHIGSSYTETARRDVSWCKFLMRATGAEGELYTKPGITAPEWLALNTAEPSAGDAGPRKGWLAMKAAAEATPPDIKTSYSVELGANDARLISATPPEETLGTLADIVNDYDAETNGSFYAAYAQILKNIRSISPDAPIFCITYMGVGAKSEITSQVNDAIREIVDSMINAGDANLWLVDMYRYMPRSKNGVEGDALFDRYGYYNHWTSLGYLWFSWAFQTYVDWIVRHNPESFKGQALIDTEYWL